MKKILGLDLGTNSIGWALIENDQTLKEGKILGMGSRIIPMDQKIMSDFESGNSISQTADRTRLRITRRLRERHLLRRNRLHVVLNTIGFLPEHYRNQIDFDKHPGQFLEETEPLLSHIKNESGKSEFLFKESFNQMLEEFRKYQPELLSNGKKIPYDWTIYYLRKKALTAKITKEELAWLILNFNQKRGYFQLRNEQEDEFNPTTQVEYVAMKVIDVQDTGETKKQGEKWYKITLENGWSFNRPSGTLPEWTGKVKEFIVTTSLNEDGTVKLSKDGTEKRSFRVPEENDWNLIKKKTEYTLAESRKTVGEFIFDQLLEKPDQKIRGKLIRTIERKFYQDELKLILEKQAAFHKELQDEKLLEECLNLIYVSNSEHRESVAKKGFINLFLNDIIFYQRPLKSKKSQIADCQYEYRTYVDKDGIKQIKPLKCIPKSNPLFIEFRLWQFIRNLKICKREDDINLTETYFPDTESRIELFKWLNDKKEIDQKGFFSFYRFPKKAIQSLRWNYVEDKIYPMNPVRHLILSRLKNAGIDYNPDQYFEIRLWHLLYSVPEKNQLVKGLKKFAEKHSLPGSFTEEFANVPKFKSEYGSYSEKAVKKLLSLMREGEFYREEQIPEEAVRRIENITERLQAVVFDQSKLEEVADSDIPVRILKSFSGLKTFTSGLNTYQACYAVYGRHSEDGDLRKWETPQDIDAFLKQEFKQYLLRNPVAEQIISESLRVVRDIWLEYGNGKKDFFNEIHVELGRELKNTKDERQRISRKNFENEQTNQRIRMLLSTLSNDPEYQNVRPESPNQMEILKIYEEGVLNSQKLLPEEIDKIIKSKEPSTGEMIRYKLWLEQKYRSPYTGRIIPLSKLFTEDYQIEHIIPQARYFDDSFNNKVICEAEVNADKKAMTGYEYIKSKSGTPIELSYGRTIKLFTLEEYEEFVKNNYLINKAKRKRLLSEDIPEEFVARQMNDTRYIRRYTGNLLSSIVREDGENEVISKNLLYCTGAVTTALKKDWKLDEVWNEIITPRFRRLNEMTNSKMFGEDICREGKNFFRISVPSFASRNFSKKRIDHRHHAMDALAIACATKDHVNYINNVNAKSDNQRYDLREKLCLKIRKGDGNSERIFKKPWEKFTEEARVSIDGTNASIKQNLRVINKTVNWYQKWETAEDGNMKKTFVKQVKGENWAIRKSLHKDTVAGLITIREKKRIPLTKAIDQFKLIVDKDLKKKIKTMLAEGLTAEQILKEFKKNKCIYNGKEISRPEVYYFINDFVAVRKAVGPDFNTATINSVTDSGIRKILLRHLSRYNEDKAGKVTEHPELAFSPDGIDEMNKNITTLNNGIPHKPIYKVRVSEPKGNKFRVGLRGNRNMKYVEADKGTNLYFAIYGKTDGSRTYSSVPLNIVIENLKNGYPPVPERDEAGNMLLFTLSPNDVVSIIENDKETFYKAVSFSGNQCFFIPLNIASPVINNNGISEFTVLNKMERSLSGIMIKSICKKVHITKTGKIISSTAFNLPLLTLSSPE